VTGTEALTRLESIGARVLLLPDGALDVTAPAGPETEALVDELAAGKPEAVAVLRARTPAHPCVSCHVETDPEDLFCPPCWERRLARMPQDVAERRRRLDHARRSTIARDGRTPTSPAPGIPPETSPERSPS
jgi:hypothetical protein